MFLVWLYIAEDLSEVLLWLSGFVGRCVLLFTVDLEAVVLIVQCLYLLDLNIFCGREGPDYTVYP